MSSTSTHRLSLRELCEKAQSDHEHFALTELPSPEDIVDREERFETFFDTPTFDLLQKNLWLRCCETIGKKDVQWTLKQGSSLWHEGKDAVMRALEDLLGKKPDAINPVSYCRCAMAVLRVRRYTFSETWWVDVCYFKKDKPLYVVGTIAGAAVADLQVDCPVPSKIVAYLTKYGESKMPLLVQDPGCCSPPSMFMDTDPFGGGPFVPVVEEDEDEGDEVSS
jgi:hypothetical protein